MAFFHKVWSVIGLSTQIWAAVWGVFGSRGNIKLALHCPINTPRAYRLTPLLSFVCACACVCACFWSYPTYYPRKEECVITGFSGVHFQKGFGALLGSPVIPLSHFLSVFFLIILAFSHFFPQAKTSLLAPASSKINKKKKCHLLQNFWFKILFK